MRLPFLAAVLVAGLGLAVPGPPPAVVLAAETVRVIPAPSRAPLWERVTARECPELVPLRSGTAVRRVAARSLDEAAPVTGARRTCSALRTGVATMLRRPAPPAGSCAVTCPDTLRSVAASARDRAEAWRSTPVWTGGRTACTAPDPTGGGGCVTGATRHGMAAVEAAFGRLGGGPAIRSASCWDAHAWNPDSDHPRGRACDLFPGTAGAMPGAAERETGWRIAGFLRDQAGPLAVAYVIWQGRYWDPSVKDTGGWGRPYASGVYDVTDVTGGHYDHVHVSFAE